MSYFPFVFQYDNARDFVTIGGLERVVRPSLTDPSRPEDERAVNSVSLLTRFDGLEYSKCNVH
jgi:hypothetical protein